MNNAHGTAHGLAFCVEGGCAARLNHCAAPRRCASQRAAKRFLARMHAVNVSLRVCEQQRSSALMT
jgi:hypothetical protein